MQTEQTAGPAHDTRIAKVIEIVATSSTSFDEAVKNGLGDASKTMRGIQGAEVTNWTIGCKDGGITEYRVDLKLAFGVERTG